MHLFFSVGEPSGDEHAAHVMEEIRRHVPQARFSGLGGPQMQQQGLDCVFQLTDLAVMGIGKVLPLLKKFRDVYLLAKQHLEQERPDAVVLVDFPGFNWHIAAAAKKLDIPVYFYCPPQLWAWAPWRIKKVRKYVDCILAVLPFEAKWYEDRGVDCEYVGHPFFDDVAAAKLDHAFMDGFERDSQFVLGVLPGSRKHEVERNFPVMLDMLQTLYQKHVNIKFPVACYKEWHRDRCQKFIDDMGVQLPISLHVGKTSEIIETAHSCLMVSGSVSLELLARKTPGVVMYGGSVLMYVLGHTLITVDYFSLPNLIAGRELMPELPYVFSKGEHIDEKVNILDRWISDRSELQDITDQMADLADEIVEVGGVTRAAQTLLKRLGHRLTEEQPLRRAA